MVRGGSAKAGGSGSASSRGGPPARSEAPDGRRCRIVIAARPALVCEALALALEHETSFDVVGRALDEQEATKLVKQHRPAVLLFDYEGLGPAAERAIRGLRSCARGTRILVLATRSSDETVERVIRAGASGLVGKQQPLATLQRAIRTVASGELWANRRATAHIVELLSDPKEEAVTRSERLTSREAEIIAAVARGLRNKEIARGLRISEKTVKSHLNNIFRKLHVDNRFAVGLYALDLRPKT